MKILGSYSILFIFYLGEEHENFLEKKMYFVAFLCFYLYFMHLQSVKVKTINIKHYNSPPHTK